MKASEIYNSTKQRTIEQKTSSVKENAYTRTQQKVLKNPDEKAQTASDWASRYASTVEKYRDTENKRGNSWMEDVSGGLQNEIRDLMKSYDSIRDYARSIGSTEFDDAYHNLVQLSHKIDKDNQVMAQFDSDEAYQTARRQAEWYDKYRNLYYNRLEETAQGIADQEEREFVQSMAANARLDRLRNMDITMAQTDLGQLRRDRDRLYDLALESVDWTDSASRKQPDNIKDTYDRRIAKLETEINTARRYQKEAEMSGVGDRNAKNYDPEFAQRAQFRGSSEVSRFINNVDGEQHGLRNPAEHPEDYVIGRTDYSQYGYDRMTQEERDIYNYWDSYDQQNGTQKAQEYLDVLQESLNSRIGTEKYESIKDRNLALKLAFEMGTGAQGAIRGIANLDKLFSGSEDYTPASATQIAANMLLQDDRENGHKMGGLGKYSPANLLQDEEGGRTWEEFAGQGAMSIGNMIPTMGTAALIGMAAPALGAGAALTQGLTKAGSLAVMGAGIAGNTYTEAINQGYSPKNAKAYAYANAASEIGTELLFGGIEGMTGSVTDALGKKLLSMTDNAILRAGARGVVDGLGETVEEGFQAVIEPWMSNVILHKDEVLRGQDVAYNMLAGFVTGAFMSGPSIALDEYGTYRTGKYALNQKIDVDTLRGIGESFDIGTEANRLAGKINENTGAYTIGRTLNEIGAGLGEQNIRDISRYLQNHGLPADVAEQNAMMLNYIAMGGELSQEQKVMVNENQLLADAFREMVMNPDSRVNQRTKGLQRLMEAGNDSDSQGAQPASRRNENGDAALKNPNRAVLAVTSREGDTMQLRLKNGDMVDSTDMTAYHDSKEALLFETARKFSTDVGDANRIANGFESSNVSMEEYCKGVEDCYRYGLYGMNYSEVKRGSLSSTVDADAARSAYMAGIREANTRVARQQKAAMEARQPGQEAAVHFNRNGRKFDAKRETAISTMEQLSKALGVDFWVFESYEKNGGRVYADETGAEHKAPNGWYDDNGIHIDLNAGNDGRGVMLYTLAHELTHHIRRYSPEKFKAFADVVMKGYGDRGISAENLIQKQIAKAKRSGRDVDYDTAYEEMIADSMEGILSDGKVLEKLKSIQESDPSLWETVKQWAKDTAEKIRKIVDAYKGQRMDSDEGKVVANMKEILPQLEELYAEGLADTRGTTVTDGDDGAKNAAKDGGVKYSMRDIDIDRKFVDFNSKTERDSAENTTVASLIERGKVTVIKSDSVNESLKNVDWSDKREARTAIKRTLKPFLGVSVQFEHNGQNATAYLTKDGSNHTAAGFNTLEKGAALSELYSLIKNAEYSYSSYSDHATVSLNTDWDYFVSVADVDGSTIPFVFAIRTIDFETRSQIYSIATKKNPDISHDDVKQGKPDGILSNYGDLPDSDGNVSHLERAVKRKLSDRDISYTPEDIQRMEDELSDVGVRLSDAERRYNSLLNNEDLVSAEKRMKEIRDNSTSLREAIRIPEYKAARAERDAIKERLNIEAEKEAYFDLSYQEKELRRNLDSARESVKADAARRKEAEAAEKAGMSEADYFRSRAAESFGYTDDFQTAGYLLPDGKLLDFSTDEGKRIGSRDRDHREISDVYEYTDGTAALNRFLADGNVRIMAETPGIDIPAGVEPTAEQYSEIKRFVREYSGKRAFMVDISNQNGSNVGTYTYEGRVNADRVVNDIKYFYQIGEVREQSEVSRFLYSDRDPDAGKMNRILQKQNAELKDTVQHLRELVRLQGKVSDGTVYTWGSVEAAARRLMNDAGAKGDVVELRKILEKVYKAMGEGSEEMTGLIDEAAQWLVDHKREAKPKLDSYAEGILKEIKGRGVRLNDSQKAEAAALMGKYQDYRRRFFGTLNISDSAGTSLDQFWAEMSESYPDVFGKDVSSSDMPRKLYDAIDSLRNMYQESEFSPEEMLESDLNEQRMAVWENFTKLVPIKTVADRNKAQVESIKQRYDQKVQSIRQTYQSQIDQLKQQRKADVQAVRANMQEKADAQQLAAKERYQQQKEDLKAAQQDTQIMEREFIRFLRAYDKVSTAGESAQAQADALKNALSEEVKKHKQDNAAWDKEYKRLLREYDTAGRNIDALEEKLTRTRESAKARVESRKQTAVRNQLKDLHGKLQKMILNPGKGVTAHAPTALAQAVADVCDLFVSNLEQAGVRRAGEYDARIATMQGKLAENPDLKYAQNGVDAANRQKVRIGEQSMKLAELRKQYDALKSGENAIYYDEHTSKMLEDLKTMLDGKDIYDMTSKELEAVKDTMQSFYHSIVSANNIWLGDYNASLTDTARQWGKEINDVNVGFIRKYMGRYLNWQMSPDTFFMATSGFAKDSVGEKISRMFAKGTERMIGVQQIYYRMFAPILENKNNQSELHNLLGRPAAKKNLVDWGLKNKNGDNVQTTRGMMLMAYMLLGQKDSRAALAESGFKVPDQKVYYKDRSRAFGDKDVGQMLTPGIAEDLNGIGKQIEDMENGLKRGEFGGMTEEDFRQKLDNLRNQRNDLILGEEGRLLGLRDNIEKMLTPMEKQVIDVAKAWFAKSGELMADAHEEVHGYRPKLIEDYVPIHRNGATVWTDIRESNGAFNLENSGFLKERVKNPNAIMLTDLFVELGSQRDAIARYCGFVKAQKDFNRIWKIQARGMSTSINGMIGAKFGTGNTKLGVSGEQYVENFIKDIGGGRNNGKGVLDYFYGAAASKSLSLNLRVAASQLASIPTAAAEVGWKNMSVGFVKGLGTALSTKKKNALAEKNAFFFQRYRGEGGITEVSDLMQKNGLWARVSGSKAGKLLFNWCQNMDVFATSTMYAMAEEAAVSRGYKRGESGFEEAVNEIYTQIIRRTQPNYTVTERSDILRDDRGGMKMLTMFKTQSNQNLNILMQASGKLTKTIHDYRYKQNGVTKADMTNACKSFANASTAVVIGGSAAFVLLRAGVNLIWAQVKSYRDDETGEVTSDKMKSAMFQEFLSSMAGMFTLGDMAYEFIYSAITGEKYYGMTDSAVGLLSDALEEINRLWQNRGKWDEMEDKDKRKEQRRSIGNIFGAFGVPAENAMKFVDAYEHWKLNVENGSLFNYSDKDTTDEQYRNRFLKAYRAGDEEGCNDLLALLAIRADESNARRAAITIRGGFRDSLKDKFLKEEVTEEEVRDIFTKYLDADEEDIDLMIAGWKGKKDTGMTLDEMQDQYLRNLVSTEAYVKYLQDYQGKDQEQAEEAELRLRCERDTGYAYDEIKEAYMEEEISHDEASEWLKTYGQVEDAEKKLKEYDFEDATGWNWDDRKDCYLSGGVSSGDLKKWLMDIDGKRSADADYYIGNLDFEKENGYAYNEKLEKYIAGEISRQQLKAALMTKGGMFEAEADRELVAYDYIKNHPNTQLSITTAYSYTRKIDNCDYTLQSAGFTEEQFLSFREQKAKCNGTDNDGDGYRDSGSVQAQVLPIIDAMPISEEQKDTLWFFCGWSKKTLKTKAPWHTR